MDPSSFMVDVAVKVLHRTFLWFSSPVVLHLLPVLYNIASCVLHVLNLPMGC